MSRDYKRLAAGMTIGAISGCLTVPVQMGLSVFTFCNAWWMAPVTYGLAGVAVASDKNLAAEMINDFNKMKDVVTSTIKEKTHG